MAGIYIYFYLKFMQSVAKLLYFTKYELQPIVVEVVFVVVVVVVALIVAVVVVMVVV